MQSPSLGNSERTVPRGKTSMESPSLPKQSSKDSRPAPSKVVWLDRMGRRNRLSTGNTSVYAGHGAFREPGTSCPSCCGCFVTGERHAWRARTPHERPRSSWQSTRGTCKRQSSCGPPHPRVTSQLLSHWCLLTSLAAAAVVMATA